MLPSQSSSKTILTVSKLNRLARSVLENQIGQIWLSAEISNFVAASSGHWYFTLKDDRAQVKAAMFKGANRKVQQRPQEGDKILVRANISLYEPRGDYQLIVEHMEPEGEGLLKQQFDALKRKLLAQGLFAQSSKQPIPSSVTKVGVITSPTGAALHDILTVLKRRNPAIEVVIYPSQVQGDAAPYSICQAIGLADQRQEVDVLIVGRGGGSLEDLWCFNDERVARAIFASSIPIISAVGHEVDVSIADFTADMRAATPSAAAELVSLDQAALREKIQQCHQRLIKAMGALTQIKNNAAHTLSQRLTLTHPQKRILQQYQQLDLLQARLQTLVQQKLTQSKQQKQLLDNRFALCKPEQHLQRQQQNLNELQALLNKNMLNQLDAKKRQLANNLHILDTVSPLATLARGYSISLSGNKLISSVKGLTGDTEMVTRFKDGEVHSNITKVIEN